MFNSPSPFCCWWASCCQGSSSHTSQDGGAPGTALGKNEIIKTKYILGFDRMMKYSYLGPKEEAERHRGGHRDTHHQAGNLDLGQMGESASEK